jgi:hypothetical protein
MFRWFVIAFVTNAKEREICLKTLQKMVFGKNSLCYVCLIGPYINSEIKLFQIDSDGMHDLNFVVEPITRFEDKYTVYLNVMDQIVQFCHNMNISGIVYYGHSSGIILGLWKGQKVLCSVTDFVYHLLIPLQPKILIFDSCYMGTLSSLYELSFVKSLKYVIASPYYHSCFSVLQTKAFTKINNTKYIDPLIEMTCEFQVRDGPRYSCLLVFEIQKIPTLVTAVKDAIQKNKFIFDSCSVINKKEDLYDLYSACKDPYLKKQIQNISELSCYINKCHKIRGVSMDVALPGDHLKIYKKMQWYVKMKNVMYLE